MSFVPIADLEAKYHYHLKPIRGADTIVPLLACLRNSGVNCFIAGGFARWVMSPNILTPDTSDIDVYFCDSFSFKTAEDILANKNNFAVELETENAITVTPPSVAIWYPIRIQLIKPKSGRTGSAEDVIGNFDLNVCQAAIYIAKNSDEIESCVTNSFIVGEYARDLKIINCQNSITTFRRCLKYIKHDYTICNKELLKILIKWDEKDPGQKARMKSIIENDNYKDMYDLLDK